jgi:hypothetical protein
MVSVAGSWLTVAATEADFEKLRDHVVRTLKAKGWLVPTPKPKPRPTRAT